jgi:hypothetical protein
MARFTFLPCGQGSPKLKTQGEFVSDLYAGIAPEAPKPKPKPKGKRK